MIKAILLTQSLGAGAGAFKAGFRRIIGEGKVLKNFTPAEQADLGADVVKYIKSLARGNRFKPTDKDTVYFSTHVIPAASAKDVPERILRVELPFGEHSGFVKTLSKTPLILEDGTRCQEPLTVEGLKNAIKKLRRTRKMESAICEYSKNPTEANKKAALAFFQSQEEGEFILRDALENKRHEFFA